MIRRAIGLLFLLGAIPAAAQAQTTYINPMPGGGAMMQTFPPPGGVPSTTYINPMPGGGAMMQTFPPPVNPYSPY